MWVYPRLVLLFGAAMSACSSEQVDYEGLESSQQSVYYEVSATDNVSKQIDADRSSDKTVSEYQTIEWPDLMPEDDFEAIMNPPDYLDEIVDGSLEDQISDPLQGEIADDSRYQQALKSTRVVAEFNNRPVRIPGFIVPLEFDGEQTITRFFLVPYFGACMHLPPPPPNQIIYASYPKGFKLESLYDPFWITGVVKTSSVENDTAMSAYSIVIDSIQPYMP